MACDGDANLGGQDFDRALASLVRDRLLNKILKKYEGISRRSVESLVFDVYFMFRLLRNCEEQKQIFSTRKVVQMGIKFNKLEKKERTIESPSPRELAVLRKKVNMLKLCKKSNPHNAFVSLEQNEDSGEWYITWGRPRRTFYCYFHHSKIFEHQRNTGTIRNFLKKTKRLALSQIVRVDAGSKSSIVRRNLEAKLVRTDQMRRVISLNTHINGKRRTIDFIVTSNGSETVDEANARWELWLKALRSMSSHYESKDKDDEDDRDLNETVEYETAADSTFDYEMIQVTRAEFETCAQKTRTGLNLWLACRFSVRAWTPLVLLTQTPNRYKTNRQSTGTSWTEKRTHRRGPFGGWKHKNAANTQ